MQIKYFSIQVIKEKAKTLKKNTSYIPLFIGNCNNKLMILSLKKLSITCLLYIVIVVFFFSSFIILELLRGI